MQSCKAYIFNKFIAGLLLLNGMLLPFASHAVDPFLDWKTLTSDNFQVHYSSHHQQQAETAIRIAEGAHTRLSAALNWQPKNRTQLVLSDETDFANGFATVININRSVLFMAPPDEIGGLEDYDDWLNLLITHEYVHVLHLDKVHGTPSVLRNTFGRQLFSFPNLFEPFWLIEGLATWYETDMERGIGRGQSTIFEMMMRAELKQGIKPVNQVNLPITTWPSGATRYLYGVYFFLFLEDVYGRDSIRQLIEQYSINLVPFSLNSTFQRVYDKDLTAMWSEFSAWLDQRFKTGFKQQEPVAGSLVTESAYRTRYVRASSDRLYYLRDDGVREQSIVMREQGKESVIMEVRDGRFDVRDNGDLIVSQLEVCEEYAIYFDLYLYRHASGETERLSECGRYRRVIWSHDGSKLYALKHDAGVYELHVLDENAQLLKRLHLFDEGDVPGWIDVSKDGKQLALSVWRKDFGWNLYSMSTRDGTLTAITRDSRIQAYPEYSPQGDYLYYSQEVDGVYDVYRMLLDTGEHQRVTRTESGALQTSIDDDRLYYTTYTPFGTSVAVLENVRSLETHVPVTGSPLKPYELPIVQTQQEDYNPWPLVSPAWWFPVLELTEDITRLGITTAGNDALGIHNYFATAAFDFDNSVFDINLVYGYSNLLSIGVSRDNDLFKDSQGNKLRILGSDQLQFVFAFPQSGLKSSHLWLAAIGWERISDSKLFNGASSIGEFNDNLLGLAWLYFNAERHPLSISLNDGRDIRLVAEDGNVLNSDLDGQVYSLRWQEYLRLGGEHVLALQAFYGKGVGRTSRFQLGGEDNGVSIDLFLNQSGSGLFGRRDYALRGYEDGLPQLRGRNAQLYSAEWRFPGQRIERGIMVPPVGIMQWSGALFAETGAAYDSDDVDVFYSSVGAEFNADLNLVYLVPLTARIGLAHGLDESIGDTRLYLSLGASF